MSLKLIFVCIASVWCTIANAQYWLLGGNPPSGSFGVNTTNNFIGTDANNNTFLRIGVQGSQDIFVDNDNSKLYPVDVTTRPHGGHWVGLGRVFTATGTLSNFFNPKAHLHIDGGSYAGTYGSFGTSLRPWFNTGTFYTENSDGMYIGLRSITPNFSYAVINWGDDAGGGAGNSDYLSFNFTTGPGIALQNSIDGIELGRFSPTAGRGTFGIGNFQVLGYSTEPVRRLEILDADPQTGVNTNSPQLRTTYLYNTSPSNGIFTEFQTTSLGDMYFNTRSNTTARRFGFHDNTPGNTVEITANGSSPIPPTPNGSSGLRFTNMTSSNIPTANPGNKVLSVNATGDVILVAGNGLATANNGLIYNTTSGAVQLGGNCGNPFEVIASSLLTDRALPLNNRNFWFVETSTNTGGVGVGSPSMPPCTTGNTFEVNANAKNLKYGSINASGVRLTQLKSTSSTIANGVYGVNSAKVLTVDQDGDVVLTNALASNFGGPCGSPVSQTNLPTDWRIGMNTFSVNFIGTGNVNIGDILVCKPGSTSVARLWLRNSFGPPNPYVGLRVDNGSGYAAEFMNVVFIGGSGVSPGPGLIFSDRNLKENITTMNSSLSVLAKLNPVSYNLRRKALPQLNVDVSKTYGLIAQDVETVIPELVKEVIVPAGYDSSGAITNPSFKVKSLNYIGLIPFLIGGVRELNDKQNSMQAAVDKIILLERLIQEQQLTIESLKTTLLNQNNINSEVQKQLAELLSKLKACCTK